MKTFITLLVIVAIGFGVWKFWSANNTNVAYQSTDSTSATSSPYVTDYPAITEAPVATSQASATVAPRNTATPAPGLGGSATLPPRAPIFANLASMNGSQESGVVALTANDNDLATFTFNMNNYPYGESQKVAIVGGTCSSMGNVAWWLQPLMNGSSMSILQTNYLDIAQSKTRYAVVVYGLDNQTPYACGQLR